MINWLKKKRYISIIIVILIALEIFYFSSIPGGTPSPGKGLNIVPFMYHLIVFFLFNFFILLSLHGEKKINVKYIFIAIIVSIVYAFSDEFHQIFVPLRYPDLADIFIDSLGIFISTITYFYSEKNNL